MMIIGVVKTVEILVNIEAFHQAHQVHQDVVHDLSILKYKYIILYFILFLFLN